MIDLKTFVRKLLINDSGYLGVMTANATLYEYPNEFENLPIVSFKEDSQAHDSFGDNIPQSFDSSVQFDIFTAKGVDTLPIGQAIDNVMVKYLFSLTMADDIGDPENKIEHRVQRYRRNLIPADIF